MSKTEWVVCPNGCGEKLFYRELTAHCNALCVERLVCPHPPCRHTHPHSALAKVRIGPLARPLEKESRGASARILLPPGPSPRRARCRMLEGVAPPPITAGSNRLFNLLDSYARSPE